MKGILFCFSITVSNLLFAQPGYINTYAGNGSAGYSGDGGLASAAELSAPEGLAVDTSGNLYVADNGNGRIRKINLASGIITTVAGNGTQGYNNDYIQATAAELNHPCAVALDDSGNIFIADYLNYRVRKVFISSGIITTVAGNGTAGYSGDGNLATTAELDIPVGVVLDSLNNIFIADANNYRIRKVTASTRIINTYAGNGVNGYSGDGGPALFAEISYTDGIAKDDSDNLYIADFDNYVIRKINSYTGKITTVAGDGILGYSGNGGFASTAELDAPDYIYVDAQWNIYIVEENDNRLRVVNPSTSIINTIAGNGALGFSGDGGPATAAEFSWASGVVTDASGNIYIADKDNERIRKITESISTGIGHQAVKEEIRIYPNPANDKIFVQLSNNEIAELNLYTITGQEVWRSNEINAKEINIPVSNLPVGLYILKIQTNNNRLIIRKITVER